jgi:hypothetical protein
VAGEYLKITLQVSAGTAGCEAGSSSATSSIQMICCRSAVGFAYSMGLPVSQCLRQSSPNDTGCEGPKDQFGLINRGPASGTIREVVASAGTCRPEVNLGFYQVGCDKADRTMMFRLRTYRSSRTQRMFWMGCARPAVKSCMTYKAPTTIRNAEQVMESSFRAVYWSVRTPTSGNATCKCSEAYWSIYEAGKFVGIPTC